ncbi:TauD/TfdA family dioxygenase [Longispora sp. NPDC051575]|uniref:TauD/TfdA family dioxygenase n=1 Tax=Longispora sp. NPDC051575 TaxID=3154943 RepID=UPI003412BBDC
MRELVGNGHTSLAVHTVTEALDGLDAIHADLATVGAVLLRGLPADLDLFDRVVRTVGGEPLEYTERSTPRSEVQGNIYTSTEYPAAQSIPMHNENSYSDTWPGRLFFVCHTAAETGGATPIADSRAMLRRIPQAVRDRFADGVVYTRAFQEDLGLSWQEAFQTQERTVVEEYCGRHGQQFEWTDYGLRTRHHRPATQKEPVTGEDVWFNQANLFHVSSLDAEVSEMLQELYAVEDLPRHATLADGSPITAADLDAIREAYDEVSLALPWRVGDVMVVNNMLVAHGRQPFTGERRILVAMTAAP